MKKPHSPIKTTITSLSPEGFGLSQHNEKQVLSIGAFPGETIQGQVIKKRKGRRWVVPEAVTIPSPYRIDPQEDHYLSCSPWQAISYDYQIELKKQMVKAAYAEYAQEELPINTFYAAKQQYGYRTKMEYSFWNDNGLHLAFHKRGSPFVNVPLPQGCLLGSKPVNKVALQICKAVETAGIAKRDLKTLTLRESKTNGDIIALLLVTIEQLDNLPDVAQIDGLKGITIAYSSPLSPASRIDTILYQEGQQYLEESINGLSIRYPLDGFFQNNLEMFQVALKDIGDVVNYKTEAVELYSGVGTIGLALHNKLTHITGVEVVPSSIEFAMKNEHTNNVVNYKTIHLAAEKIDPAILKTDTLILDPPRSGLHPDVVKSITASQYKPKQIIYLSCNPSTQARDYALLKPFYSPTLLNSYDFYPQTMHLESLLVLEVI